MQTLWNEINKHDLVFITMKCRYSRGSTDYPLRSRPNYTGTGTILQTQIV